MASFYTKCTPHFNHSQWVRSDQNWEIHRDTARMQRDMLQDNARTRAYDRALQHIISQMDVRVSGEEKGG